MPILIADLGSIVMTTFGEAAAITVTRYPGTGTFGTDGIWIGGAPTVTPMTAAVQPAGARVVQQLPEGERKTDAIVIYTVAQLIDSASGQEADRILWRGRTYRAVKQLDDWSAQANYYRCVAVLEGQA